MKLIRYQYPEIHWSPFNRLASLREQMDDLFKWPFPTFTREFDLLGGWSPPLDLYQDKDNLYAKLELPGVNKDDVSISLHEGVLTVSGERKVEAESAEADMYRNERYFGKFNRSVTLPSPVDVSKVKANYTDGILTVTMPKTEEAKPRQIPVAVS
jgi:HSP20 family protein